MRVISLLVLNYSSVLHITATHSGLMHVKCILSNGTRWPLHSQMAAALNLNRHHAGRLTLDN